MQSSNPAHSTLAHDFDICPLTLKINMVNNLSMGMIVTKYD